MLEEVRIWNGIASSGARVDNSPLQVATDFFTFKTISESERKPNLLSHFPSDLDISIELGTALKLPTLLRGMDGVSGEPTYGGRGSFGQVFRVKLKEPLVVRDVLVASTH